MKNTLKLLLVTGFILLNYVSSAIIIIPMPMHHGGGEVPPNAMLGILIALNLVCFLIYFIRAIMWVFGDKSFTFFEYVISAEYEVNIINNICLITINGLAAFIALAIYITNLLN